MLVDETDVLDSDPQLLDDLDASLTNAEAQDAPATLGAKTKFKMVDTTCPVCLDETPDGPIYQCHHGHLVHVLRRAPPSPVPHDAV